MIKIKIFEWGKWYWFRWWRGRKTTETENEGVIHRNITENETETNQDTLNKEKEECPDDLYDEEGETKLRLKMKVWYTEILMKTKQKLIRIPWIME